MLKLNSQNSKIQTLNGSTRLTNKFANSFVLDSGSLPLVLDKKYCINTKILKEQPPNPLNYGGVKVTNLISGQNKVPIMNKNDIGQFNAICVNNLEQLTGTSGIIGIARGGDVCISGESSCSNSLKWSNFSYMHQSQQYGFYYTSPETSNEPMSRNITMVPIDVNGTTGTFNINENAGEPYLNNPNNGYMTYASIKRRSKQYPYMIFDLGWPPQATKKMGGHPCKYGASFVGLGDLAQLQVNYKTNKLAYQTKNNVDIDSRCE